VVEGAWVVRLAAARTSAQPGGSSRWPAGRAPIPLKTYVYAFSGMPRPRKDRPHGRRRRTERSL